MAGPGPAPASAPDRCGWPCRVRSAADPPADRASGRDLFRRPRPGRRGPAGSGPPATAAGTPAARQIPHHRRHGGRQLLIRRWCRQVQGPAAGSSAGRWPARRGRPRPRSRGPRPARPDPCPGRRSRDAAAVKAVNQASTTVSLARPRRAGRRSRAASGAGQSSGGRSRRRTFRRRPTPAGAGRDPARSSGSSASARHTGGIAAANRCRAIRSGPCTTGRQRARPPVFASSTVGNTRPRSTRSDAKSTIAAR